MLLPLLPPLLRAPRLRHVAARAAVALALLAPLPPLRAASDTAHAVQASATVQASPAQITLAWTASPARATGYALSRKDPGAGAWTPLVNLPGDVTAYTDTQVSTGRVYEYQVVRQAGGLTGYGYVAAGIDVPAVDARGRVILVLERSIAGPLAAEIDRLVRDLVGEGWLVTRREVGRDDAPAAVREAIRSAYQEDPAATRAVLLLGRVPVARSGNLNVDGHRPRPLPADAYYGDMDGAWTDSNRDGVFDQDRIPSDIELQVGRVDFADLGTFGSEVDLLRRYLDKNHAYRTGSRRVPARALVGDRFGDFNGEAFGASGFRNFAALLGPDRIAAANVENDSAASERWISRLTSEDWLWVFGGGGGDVSRISGLGLRGPFGDVEATDLVNQRARGMFYLLFGSWFVDWTRPDNIMRAALAAPDFGLTAAWSGRPHLFFHPMALGETIGHGLRLSQNNAGIYTNQVNRETRGIHIALLGDPTLRMHIVAPPGALGAAPGDGAPTLNWTASPDASSGYHVYRATDAGGPYVRLTSTPVTGTSYTDQGASDGAYTYQVRALRRETSGGGTYFNLSTGTFAAVTVSGTAPTPAPAPAPSPAPPATPAPAPPAPAVPPATSTPGAGGSGGGSATPAFLCTLALLVLLRARRKKIAAA